jgi:hypothetical protein
MRNFALLIVALGLIGCADYEKRTETVETVRRPAVVETTPAPAPAPAAAVVQPSLDDVIRDVQEAPDGPTEAAALRRLHGWLAGEQMTYKVGLVRPDTGEAVARPTVATIPLRANVSIFNKLQPFRDFGFLVKDNRNLTILGVE